MPVSENPIKRRPMPAVLDYSLQSWGRWSSALAGKRCLLAAFWVTLGCLCLAEFQSAPLSPPSVVQPAPKAMKRSFSYNMTGRVRLLLFWVSRENVGRGIVGLEDYDNPKDNVRSEKCEILFGTIPVRVPGGINRWGYGKETALWRINGASGVKNLESSQFLGFMRHSAEESISQVNSSQRKEQGQQQYWYDGILSYVQPQEAHTEVYYFPMTEEVSLEKMEQARRVFDLRRERNNPDQVKRLSNVPVQYGTPQGFLTCLRGLMESATRRYREKGDKGWEKEYFQSTYAYNARLYKMESISSRLHRSFAMPLPAHSSQQLSSAALNNVAEVEYQVTNYASGERYRFTLWFPMSGALENIPLQIRHNPRWWLQVQLQLIDIKEGQP
jgi:hypothetical protein